MYGFDRLIKKMDEIAERLEERVIMQIGYGKYIPKNAIYFRFTNREKIEELVANARIIVSHAGIGSILLAMKYRKPLVLVPRRKEYGEHIDDHQMEIARELEGKAGITVVYDINTLEKAIESSNINHYIFSENNTLTTQLKIYLSQLEEK